MLAGKYSFTLEQGSTTDFSLIYKDENRVPIDIHEWDARMQIRPYLGSSEVITTLSSSLNSDGTGLNMESASNGVIRVYISSCTSSLFNFDEAVYDLEIMSGSDCPVTNRIIEGRIRLSKEVTKWE